MPNVSDTPDSPPGPGAAESSSTLQAAAHETACGFVDADRPYVLLTGATGLLGRYLLRDLAAEHVPLAVLVRPSRKADPALRVEAMRLFWAEQGVDVPSPRVLAGDILSENLGLSGEDRMWAAEHCGLMLHNAASLSFVSTGRASEPWRSNVDGTANVLEFCRDAAIRQFHHVSTAYVAGKRTGCAREDELDVGQEFGNPYEESKLQAEQMVKAAAASGGPLDQVTTYRPGIIIGDSQTGFTSTFHNIYAFLQIAHTMLPVAKWEDDTKKPNASHYHFAMGDEARKHLVPVDWVSAAMSYLLARPALHGRTYHLTPRVPIRVPLLRDMIEEACGYYGVSVSDEPREGAGEADELVQLFMEQQRVYDSYWRDDPKFDDTNTRAAVPFPCPHVDRDMLVKLARTAIDMRFRHNDPRVKTPEPAAGELASSASARR